MQVLSIFNLFKSSKSNFYFGIVATIAVAYGLFLNMIKPGDIDIDSAICGAVANKNSSQGGLYISAWENKPPALIYLLQGLMFFSQNKVYIFFSLALFSAIFLALGIYFLVYKYVQSVTVAIILCTFSFGVIIQPHFYGYGLYTELFCAIFLVYALVFYEYPSIKNHIYIAAIFAGFSFWFKEPCLLAAMSILGLLITKNKQKSVQFKLLFYFFLPSIYFILLLMLNGSLIAFIKTIQYNFAYINTQERASLFKKLFDFRTSFIYPSIFLILALLMLFYWLLKKKKLNVEHLFFTLITLSSSLFFILSPYFFGHYYLTFVIMFFVLVGKFYESYKLSVKFTNSLFIAICFYLTYLSINHYVKPQFTYKIHDYQPDNITKKLIAEPNKTLFVDYAYAVEYLIKSNNIHHAFLPVPLSVHFNETPLGIKNRERIWYEMNHPKADFLITTHTTSYFYWSLPNHYFYEEFYEKIDSIHKKDDNVMYLWQLKKK